jgi:hypothetical protein
MTTEPAAPDHTRASAAIPAADAAGRLLAALLSAAGLAEPAVDPALAER